MTNETPGDTFSEEVEDRLQNLFGEEEPPSAAEPSRRDIKPHPLRGLKSVILSIDWEITDDVMKSFVEEVALLQEEYRNDKIVLVFLQLLGSLGAYIRRNLSRSHPDAFKLLNSLFAELERIVQAESLTEVEKKKILALELGKYKKLKNQLIPNESQRVDRRPAAAPSDRPAAGGGRSDIIAAIEELKLFVQQELSGLREEIRRLGEKIAADS